LGRVCRALSNRNLIRSAARRRTPTLRESRPAISSAPYPLYLGRIQAIAGGARTTGQRTPRPQPERRGSLAIGYHVLLLGHPLPVHPPSALPLYELVPCETRHRKLSLSSYLNRFGISITVAKPCRGPALLFLVLLEIDTHMAETDLTGRLNRGEDSTLPFHWSQNATYCWGACALIR